MKILIALLAVTLVACGGKAGTSQTAAPTCKGVYTEIDPTTNETRKYNDTLVGGACQRTYIELSQYEKGMDARRRHNIKCKPQPAVGTVRLMAQSNFYDYRNGRLYLELDGATGTFRRLYLGEGQGIHYQYGDIEGKTVFARETGCFYQREDHETEPVNPKNYGKQILLDLELSASSDAISPLEIFKYDNVGTTWTMTRFDRTTDWNWNFCPQNSVPWEYCTAMRNGNIMYFPILSFSVQNDLTNEAVLIRTQFNFTEIPQSVFDGVWDFNEKNTPEVSQGGDWKYITVMYPDIPPYIDRAWRDYLMGNRLAMPDTESPQIAPLCYNSWKSVTLSDGSTGRIQGQVCLVDGVYTFQ